MKTYDRVLELLERDEECRNSDRWLIWQFWRWEDLLIGDEYIPLQTFLNATTPESITRARRKVQELHPELRSTKENVAKGRAKKQDTKGTFIFREDTKKGVWK